MTLSYSAHAEPLQAPERLTDRLAALLMQRKMWGVRVHNVVATSDAIAIVQALRDSN